MPLSKSSKENIIVWVVSFAVLGLVYLGIKIDAILDPKLS
jgi:putative exporter of polyketide antibiotics